MFTEKLEKFECDEKVTGGALEACSYKRMYFWSRIWSILLRDASLSFQTDVCLV